MIRPLSHFAGRALAFLLPAVLLLSAPRLGTAQEVSITNGAAYAQCHGSICDPGGSTGFYPNGQDATATLCPTGGPGAGPATRVRFVAWNIAPGPGDCLKIYQGTSTGGAPFATGSHSAGLLHQEIVSTHPSGCLTFDWDADGSGSALGWKAVVLTGPQAGDDAAADVPTGGAPFQLMDSLGGYPEVGGSWTGPAGSCDGTFDPAVDPYGMYTYVVAGSGPCSGASAELSVQEPQSASAGSNSSLTLCTTSGVADLFAALGGSPDPGGTWTGPGGTPSDDTFDPLVDQPGVYTYTVPCDPQPCVDPSATVTVTVNQPPSAGTSATTSTCSNSTPFNLFTRLGGSPNPGGAWTGPGGAPVPATFTPGTSAPGVYTYTVVGTPPCANASATVTVTVVNAPNAGEGSSFTVCSNDASFTLISRLGGTPQAGGTWVGPGGPHGATFIPGTHQPGQYTYTVAGTAPCAAASAVLTIAVQQAPRPGTNANTTVCSTDASFSLFSRLGGTPDGGGSWTAPGGGTSTGTFVPGTSIAGTYTYTVPGIPPCANASATVTVAVNTAPNAGSNVTVTRCSNDAAFNMFTLLGGTPSPGGTWVGPSGNSNGTFTPGTSTPGPYTYTVTGVAPCANATAVVTVNIVTAPHAGTNGSTTVCASDAPFSLFALLGGSPDAGGTWTAPGGGANNGTFTPATSTAGAYTYTVVGTAPCANAMATVTVSVVQPPNAGISGTLSVCSNGPTVSLINSLTGSPALTGTWQRPGGTPHSGNLNPATDPAGTYTYTVAGTAPCTSRSSTVQVTKVQAPDAGNNGSITVCSTQAPFQLFTVLGGTPSGSGTWRTPSNAPFSGTFTPGTTPAGIYKYVVLGNAPCPNDTGFVTVVVNTAPNAGTNASSTVCSNQASFNLFTRLGGTPNVGGTWTGPNNQPFPGGIYVPGTSLPGAYTYTVAGLSPCLDASAVVAITENRQPVAGTNASLSICSTDAPVDLFASLGGSPDPGGVWTGPGGVPNSGVFFPGTSTPGVYTYTLIGTAPCTNATATVAITVTQAPNAGENAVITVCADGGNVDLFTVLEGTPENGGTWVDVNATGNLTGSTFSPAGMTPGNYDFTYTVTGNGQCGDDQATVRVTIVAALNAGTNGSLTVCGSNTLVDLFPGLGGTPQAGGNWVDLSGTGALTGQFFNSTLVPGGTYNFRYELSGSASCTPVQALVSVTVIAPRRPGINASTTVCSISGQFQLFPLLTGNPQPGGTWSNGTGSYNPPTNDPGVFTYTLNGTAPCPNASATVTVVEVAAPYAGESTTATVCSNDGPFNMTMRLGGSPQPGAWTFGGNPHSNIFVPGVDVPGVYVYTVAGNAPCGPAIATLAVTVNTAPDAGGNGEITVCSDGPSFSLFDQLTGSPMGGGTWTRPGPPPGNHNGFYQPPMDNPGAYTYTVTGTAPCASDIAIVTVTENRAPRCGNGGNITLCSGGASVNLFSVLTGNPDANGVWTGPAPSTAVFNGSFIPGVTPPGTYTYTVAGEPPCANSSTTITVSIVQPPNAGTSRTITVCENSTPFPLIEHLGGTPAPNGTWTLPPPGGPSNGFFTPGTSPPGVYIYTVAGTTPCANAVATLNVIVNPRANAGNDANISVCSSGGAQNMFPLLGTGAQVGGTWKRQLTGTPHNGVFQPGSDPPGTYVYTVQGPIGCQADSAYVAVTVNQQPNAGFNGQTVVCDVDAPFALVDVLNGTPQLIGDWVDPLGASTIGIFIPGQSLPGVYTYTVNGTAPCPNAQAQVNVIENHRPIAGGNGVRTVCSNNPPFSLISVLTGSPEPGGTWFDPSGTPVGSLFTPGNSLPGAYKYRIQGLAPCASDSATATIIVNPAPNAGISTAVAICSSSSQVALIDLLGGSPSSGGVWTINSNEHSQFFDPMVDVSGAYIYTVVGLAPCVNAVSQVQVTLVQQPNAGLPGTIAACVGDGTIQLATGLGGSPNANGTWSDLSGTGQLSGGELELSSLAPGTYLFRYTVAGSGPCAAATADVTVVLSTALDAGENATAIVCENQLVDLFTRLGGTPQAGGNWTDLDGSGGLVGGAFNAAQTGGGTTWRFRYVIPATSTCVGDTAIVTVNVEEGPYAGCDGARSFCLVDPPAQLFSALGCDPDEGGFWLTPSNTSHATNGMFQPGIDPVGTYKYVVPAVGDCVADTALVQVVVRQPANAGVGGPVSICSTDAAVNLFTFLGPNAQSGGTWTLNNESISGIYNPAVDVPGNYIYRVTAQAPCQAEVAVIVVTEPVAPEAGNDRTITICSSDAPFNMRNQLGGLPQQGGTWYFPVGTTHPQTFNPAVDLGGVYTYVVSGTAPCANDTARLTINLSIAPNAGTSTTISACATQTDVNLFQALGSPETGGVWTDLDLSGALNGDIFDATVNGPGTYRFQYAINATAPCVTAVSVVTVVVGSGADAGLDNTLTICGAIQDFQLITALDGTPDTGGTWTDLAGTGAMVADGILDATLLPTSGQSAFVYSIVDPGCGTVQATVLITASEYPDPGAAGPLVYCNTAAPVDLFDQLGGEPQLGGTWTGPNGVFNGTLDPSTFASGAYAYTLAGNEFCSDTAAVFTITINPRPDAGLPGQVVLCDTLTAFPLITALNGTPDQGGTWSPIGGAGGLNGSVLNSTQLEPGEHEYLYTVAAGGCPTATALVKVEVVTNPVVVNVSTNCNERERTYVVTFTIEGGDPASYTTVGAAGSLSTEAPYIFVSDPVVISSPFSVLVSDANACAEFRVEATAPCSFDTEVFVPQSFSPNGDGVNETFFIPGIEGFPQNTVSIFNRWGSEVFKGAGYDNRTVVWNGSSPEALMAGMAAAGTYFYVLDLGNGSEPITGFIQLVR